MSARGAVPAHELEAFIWEVEDPDQAQQPPGWSAAARPKRAAALLLAVAVLASALLALRPRESVAAAAGGAAWEALVSLDEEREGGAEGPYKCGAPLVGTNQTDLVLKEYAAWKEKWVKNVTGGLCIMRPPGDVSGNPKYENDCVSEGNGYGMLISAYLGDRETFEGLWEFVQTYADKLGNMHWQIWPDQDKPVVGKGSATDVDEDTAIALLVAAEKWGGEYPKLAKEQIERVWEHDIGKDNFIVKAGDMWGSCTSIDVSYFSPGYYQVFADVTGNKDWEKVIEWGYGFLGKCNENNNGTGLTPQWTDCECSKSLKIGKYPDQYWCDASRVPWRMAMNAAWHCNEDALKQARLFSAFFSAQGGAAKIQNGYTLEGEPLHTTDTDNACTESCFITMAAAAVMVDDNATDEVKADFWKTSVSIVTQEKQSCYYCDALRMLSLLFTSGLMHAPQIKV